MKNVNIDTERETPELSVETTLQSIMDTLRTLASSVSKLTVESEITDVGHDEAWKANVKRMYDEYQHESLESIRRNRSYVDKTLSDAGQYDTQRQGIANQALQNAVETANIVSKQCVRHGDLAIDRQWNLDEVAGFSQKVLSGIQDPAVAAAMATAIANAMLKK